MQLIKDSLKKRRHLFKKVLSLSLFALRLERQHLKNKRCRLSNSPLKNIYAIKTGTASYEH
jgi:hypothetical protein